MYWMQKINRRQSDVTNIDHDAFTDFFWNLVHTDQEPGSAVSIGLFPHNVIDPKNQKASQ